MFPSQFLPIFPWLAGLLGLILGSFYTVCVHRYLTGASIVLPGSHCPKCLRPLRWWENIPLVSYLILRGRCAGCKAPISWRYPLMEFLSMGWAVLSAKHVIDHFVKLHAAHLAGAGLNGLPGLFLPWLLLMAVGGVFLVASFIDLVLYILPDTLIYPGIVLGVATGVYGLGLPLDQSLIGAAVGAGLFWLLRFVHMRLRGIEGLGLGDVKLMAMIGALTGLLGLPAAVLFGAGSALFLSPLFRFNWREAGPMRMPFGPFLCLGCMLTILWGDAFMKALAGG
jgi:leader peptidase (prepilin peptidase)/N-methyltransferase